MKTTLTTAALAGLLVTANLPAWVQDNDRPWTPEPLGWADADGDGVLDMVLSCWQRVSGELTNLCAGLTPHNPDTLVFVSYGLPSGEPEPVSHYCGPVYEEDGETFYRPTFTAAHHVEPGEYWPAGYGIERSGVGKVYLFDDPDCPGCLVCSDETCDIHDPDYHWPTGGYEGSWRIKAAIGPWSTGWMPFTCP